MTTDAKPSVIRFFLDGYKPAISFQNGSQQDGIHFLKKKGYPYTKVIQNNTIFFQNPEKMKEFEVKIQEGRKKNKRFDDFPILGEALGIPPSAIEANMASLEANFAINYFGLMFMTTFDLVNENLKWLKKNYPVPRNYPGIIEVIDKRETVYQLKLTDVTNFKPLKQNGIFPNKLCPIFLVTAMPQVMPMQIYNGYDIKKALRSISQYKDQNPQVDVWVADKLLKSYLTNELDQFKTDYTTK
jgi:hypothetical protein